MRFGRKKRSREKRDASKFMGVLKGEFGKLCGRVSEWTGFIRNEKEDSLRSLFKKYDRDNSGAIEISELRVLLCELFGWDEDDVSLEEHDVLKEFVAANDLNSNGQLEFAEFVRLILSEDAQSWEGGVKQTFQSIDTNGNGYIEEEEFMAKLTGLGAAPEDVRAALEGIDKDNDGRISYVEFLAASRLGNLSPHARLLSLLREGATGGSVHGAMKAKSPDERAWARLDFDKRLRLEHVFSIFDANGSGQVDAGEVKRLLRVMGLNPSSADAEAYLRECDLDASGGLSKKEFALLLQLAEARRNPETEKELVLRALKAFDRNGDGRVDAADMRAVLTKKRSPDSLTDEEADRILDRLDRSGDGTIDAVELSRFLLGTNVFA
ncbi:unnamed protein product [Pedinophyceae sp. YPF-701]|nr:unnamed protein product [Pedinophyceae sp. YPF-701]